MSDTLTCMFKCECGLHKFEVRYRTLSEDVIEWIDDAVRPAMAKAHREQSPRCNSAKADLMLPVDVGSDGVGRRTLQ